MGMFNDDVNKERTSWTYEYTGHELLPYAVKLFNEFLQKEMEARDKMASYMKDVNVSHNDQRVDQAKREIQSFGTLKEQCLVFKHEFQRTPEKKYLLGLGDVTFFGLTSCMVNE